MLKWIPISALAGDRGAGGTSGWRTGDSRIHEPALLRQCPATPGTQESARHPGTVVNDNGIIRYCQGPGVAGPRQRPHYPALRSAQNAAGGQPYV